MATQCQKYLNSESSIKVHFSGRRMNENYILHPAAIVAVANCIEGFRSPPLTRDEVEQWMESHRWEAKYVGDEVGEPDRTRERWVEGVNGAKTLADLFAQLSDGRVAFE